MTIIEALFLGLIQGITEFIPVSSSGHLAIIENLLNIKDASGLLFAAAVHFATLIAVFAALRREIKKLFLEVCRGTYDIIENIRIYRHNRHEKDARRYKRVVSNNYRKLFLLLIVSVVPTVIEGYLLQDAAALAGSNLFSGGRAADHWDHTFGRRLFPKRKKNPERCQLFCCLCDRNFSGNDCFPGGFPFRDYSGSVPCIWISEEICHKIYASSVDPGVYRSIYPGMHPVCFNLNDLGTAGMLCGRRNCSRDRRIFLYWENDESFAE